MPNNKTNSLDDFEQSLSKLEGIVRKMEQGELSLEQSLSAFEEGVNLTRSCQDTLRQAELKVSELIQEGEELISQPFQPPLTP